MREKRKENGVLKGPSNYFSDEEEDCLQSSEDSAPLPKKQKNDAECETPVKNDVMYPEIMSPPLSVPKNSNSNNQIIPKASSTPGRPWNVSSARCNLQKNCASSFQLSNTPKTSTPPVLSLDGNSNSSWAEMESYVIGNVQIHPPTLATRQMLILR